ncbi:MAG: hypothetical protein WBP08_04295 [Saprospiraceae bacterium]
MENYIEDILGQLIEEANDLKRVAITEFDIGILHGYYRAISILLNQAESFGIIDKLPSKLRDFKPEELISKK